MSEREFVAVGCSVLTVSDTRTRETDSSGTLIRERLLGMGHRVESHEIIPDDRELLRTRIVQAMENPDIAIVICTGGTGITGRDITPDTVAQLATRDIPGFGELFRWLSYREIGSSTVQSRAGAWLCKTTLVFALPGSTGACRLAMDEILESQLDYRHRPCNFIQLMPRFSEE